MSEQYEILSKARHRLRSFSMRWESESYRPEKPWLVPSDPAKENPLAEQFRQDADAVAKLMHEVNKIATDMGTKTLHSRIALEALCQYDYQAVRDVSYAALAEIASLLGSVVGTPPSGDAETKPAGSLMPSEQEIRDLYESMRKRFTKMKETRDRRDKGKAKRNGHGFDDIGFYRTADDWIAYELKQGKNVWYALKPSDVEKLQSFFPAKTLRK